VTPACDACTEDGATLRLEVDGLTHWYHDRCASAETKLRAENEWLRCKAHVAIGALESYGQHKPWCSVSPDDFCDCGLQAAIDELDEVP